MSNSVHRSAFTPARRRVLIVANGRDRGALAAARALNAAGWYVGVGTPEGGGVLGSTKASAVAYRVQRPRTGACAFVEGVRRAVDSGAFDIVFGGGDDWMAALSAYRSQIPALVAHPPLEVVQSVLDKLKLAQYAEKFGISTPRTELATDQSLAAWQGPLIVKCKEHWAPGQTHRIRIEAKLFATAAAARPQVERIMDAGAEAVLQAPISGALGALIGVFHEGRLVGRTQQRSCRLWPTPNGASARAITVPTDEELTTKVEALLQDVGWTGLVELQFLTGEDGIPYLIDFNGRFFGSMALAETARPGLVDAWGRQVLGNDVPDLNDARVGVRYSWAAGDLRRSWVERRGGLAVDLLDTLRWSLTAKHSTFSLTDPRPSLTLTHGRLRRRS